MDLIKKVIIIINTATTTTANNNKDNNITSDNRNNNNSAASILLIWKVSLPHCFHSYLVVWVSPISYCCLCWLQWFWWPQCQLWDHGWDLRLQGGTGVRHRDSQSEGCGPAEIQDPRDQSSGWRVSLPVAARYQLTRLFHDVSVVQLSQLPLRSIFFLFFFFIDHQHVFHYHFISASKDSVLATFVSKIKFQSKLYASY